MDVNDTVGELLETGQNTAAGAVKAVASDVKGQLGIADRNDPQQKALHRVETDDEVKRFYEPSQYVSEMVLGQNGEPNAEEKIKKAREELAALARQHKETYFDPLINPPKPQAPPKAEQLAREKQQEAVYLQQQQAKQNAEEQVLHRQQAAVEMRGSPG